MDLRDPRGLSEAEVHALRRVAASTPPIVVGPGGETVTLEQVVFELDHLRDIKGMSADTFAGYELREQVSQGVIRDLRQAIRAAVRTLHGGSGVCPFCADALRVLARVRT